MDNRGFWRVARSKAPVAAALALPLLTACTIAENLPLGQDRWQLRQPAYWATDVTPRTAPLRLARTASNLCPEGFERTAEWEEGTSPPVYIWNIRCAR